MLLDKFLTTIAQTLSDMAIMGEKSDVEYYADALENAGFTEEAKKMALKEFFLNNPVRNSTTAFVSNAIVSGANSAASGYRKYEDVDEMTKLTEIGKAEAIELQNKKENVIIDSVVCNCVDGVNETVLFPGTTVFENPFGGKTVVFAGTPRTYFTFTEAFSFLSETRKNQLVRIMRNENKLPVYYTEDEDIYFRAAEMPDDRLFCSLVD